MAEQLKTYDASVLTKKASPAEKDALVRGLQQRDDDAWAFFVSATHAKDIAIARRHGLEADSEDAAQEAHIKVFRNRGRIDSTKNIGGWESAVAANQTRDELRRKKNQHREVSYTAHLPHRQSTPVQDEENLSAMTGIYGENPADVVIVNEEHQKLYAGLQQLPVELREAITLFYFGGMTGTEAALKLGRPIGTVKSQIRRGLKQLRVILADVGLEE